MSKAKAVFLDRDGVINEKPAEGEYVTKWDEVKLWPGTAEAVRCLRDVGFQVVLVSNQRAVAKGLVSTSDLDSLHERMWRELFAGDHGVDAVYYCPHDTDPPCQCRKPRPGMLLAAASDRGIDLASSWMVGDSESDVQAGRHAGCKTIRIGSPDTLLATAADEVAPSLLEASKIIQSLEPVAHDKS